VDEVVGGTVERQVGCDGKAHEAGGLALQLDRPKAMPPATMELGGPAWGKLQLPGVGLRPIYDVGPEQRGPEGRHLGRTPGCLYVGSDHARPIRSRDIAVHDGFGFGVVIRDELVGQALGEGVHADVGKPIGVAQGTVGA
jgi:hypothetical protein